ncbi:MAG TPA: phosphodiesterase, partial [Candidatus Atribacteria bacterium]|nr:phosphodiesterase [Candidatus Atribacteria bacterium]
MKKCKRVIVIGLDGATFDLIKPWAEEGKLPTFKKLIGEGAWGNLKSTVPNATIPAWPSFSTGCNPGKHGFFDFFRIDESYRMNVETRPSRAVMKPTLWEILSKNNKKVGVINVPSTYPPKRV